MPHLFVQLAAVFGTVLTAAPPLTTPWPARQDCPSYAGLELSVDDRVSSVEWRGPKGASLTLELPKLPGREGTESYRLRSEGMDCHRKETSCIVYRAPDERLLHVRAARVSRPLPPGFVAGAFDELVLHEDVRRQGPPSRADRSLAFGLRLVLPCADKSKPGIEWACDGRSCVPRTFRDNVEVRKLWDAEHTKPPRERHFALPVAGPYHVQWRLGARSEDLERLICMGGPSGRAKANGAARRSDRDIYCPKAMPLEEARPILLALARDLLGELEMVVDAGCAGACSARVEELREAARALAAAPDLRPAGIRAAFHAGDDNPVFGAAASYGWVAKLAARPGALEIACAWFRATGSAGSPNANVCRLSVATRGRRLADYAPDWFQRVELPDGGAIHVLDNAPTGDAPQTGGQDHIVIIGSALALRPAAE